MKLTYFFSFIFLMGIIPNCLFPQAPDVGHRCVNCGDDSNNSAAQNYNYQAPVNSVNPQQTVAAQNQQQFEQDKSEAVSEIKGGFSSSALKSGSGSDDLDESVKDGTDTPTKPTWKKKLKTKKGCNVCTAEGCHCVSGLCGGTRACDCGAVDCDCPDTCNMAGASNPCSGTVEDNDPVLGKVQRCQKTCACGYPAGECKCSVSCRCSRKNKKKVSP